MANEREFFPKSSTEALAYLYVKSQDLTGKSVEELYKMYWEAYDKLSEENKRRLEARRAKTV